MPVKRVLILANSIKKQARCVAGREIINVEGGDRWGGWIRPVSSSEEGELLLKHYSLQGGGKAAILDIVDISVSEHLKDPGQPENWLLAEGFVWKKVRTLSTNDVSSLIERPSDLWMESTDHSDRISVGAQADRTPQASLVMIRPTGFHVRLWREFDPWKAYTKRKTRAVFQYAGQEYSMSVTDPEFSAQYCSNHPKKGAAALEIRPPFGDNCLLCISLTPPLNEYHYKVVATVLSME